MLKLWRTEGTACTEKTNVNLQHLATRDEFTTNHRIKKICVQWMAFGSAVELGFSDKVKEPCPREKWTEAPNEHFFQMNQTQQRLGFSFSVFKFFETLKTDSLLNQWNSSSIDLTFLKMAFLETLLRFLFEYFSTIKIRKQRTQARFVLRQLEALYNNKFYSKEARTVQRRNCSLRKDVLLSQKNRTVAA